MQRILTRTRLHDITFKRDGRILIGSRLCRCINLQAGDCLGIAFHEGEYLVYAIKNAQGRQVGRCYASKRSGATLCANSVEMARTMLEAAGVRMFKASFAAGEAYEDSGRKYIPLITKLPM